MHSLKQRLNAWLAARLPRADSVLLTQRNIYILPTRPGWMLALTLLVMLLGSINEQINLGYLLTFLLAGCALVGLLVGHGTLRGLRLHLTPPAPCFAGTAAKLHITLSNARARTRYALGVRVSGQADGVHVDVPPQASITATVGWLPPARGRHGLPALCAETRFPLGTFRVWTVWRPAATVWVYPTPETAPPPLPPGRPKAGTHSTARSARDGEFDGVRAYRRGDPFKALVWKRVAQTMARGTGELVSRDQASAPLTQELWLDWALTGTADTELRASRLTAWLLQAERLGLDYGLRLPGRQFPPGRGKAHCRQCLEALALC
jgi:uncharacterized protein (DUF58 family)